MPSSRWPPGRNPLLRHLVTAALLLLAGAGVASPLPHVRFGYETRAGEEAADRCGRIWQDDGPALVADLLPAGFRADTVACLLLPSAAFADHFAGGIPDWGVGVAVAGGRLVAIDHARVPAVGRGLREVFLHEMVHALLFQYAQEVWLPAWFHEGCAMRYAGEWRFVDTVSLALEGRVPSLDRLQGRFPRAASTADRAYRTSLLAVGWLADRHGPDAVPRILDAAVRRGDFHAGFRDATGESVEEFSAAFAARMRLRFGWLVMATRWPGLFVLLALVLLVGGGRKFVLARRRLAAMDDDDARGTG